MYFQSRASSRSGIENTSRVSGKIYASKNRYNPIA